MSANDSAVASSAVADPWQQLEELKPRVASLAALNDKYGTTVAYHTHSGAGMRDALVA